MAGPSGPAFLYDFYPRSPCGERRWLRCWQLAARDISIHALLAESDRRRGVSCYLDNIISIHALLAESDRSGRPGTRQRDAISIHALLAESDKKNFRSLDTVQIFLSTLSLRRATKLEYYQCVIKNISIHALLAESDSKSAQNSGALLRI